MLSLSIYAVKHLRMSVGGLRRELNARAPVFPQGDSMGMEDSLSVVRLLSGPPVHFWIDKTSFIRILEGTGEYIGCGGREDSGKLFYMSCLLNTSTSCCA